MADPAPVRKRNWTQIAGIVFLMAVIGFMTFQLRSAQSERDAAAKKLATATADYDKAQKASTTSIAALQTQLRASNDASDARHLDYMATMEKIRIANLAIDRAAARTDAAMARMEASASDMAACRTPQSVLDAMKDL